MGRASLLILLPPRRQAGRRRRRSRGAAPRRPKRGTNGGVQGGRRPGGREGDAPAGSTGPALAPGAARRGPLLSKTRDFDEAPPGCARAPKQNPRVHGGHCSGRGCRTTLCWPQPDRLRIFGMAPRPGGRMPSKPLRGRFRRAPAGRPHAAAFNAPVPCARARPARGAAPGAGIAIGGRFCRATAQVQILYCMNALIYEGLSCQPWRGGCG